MATKAPLLNYYEVLGVDRYAGPGEIESAYRAGIMRFRDQAGAGEQTRRIGLAYRALSNPERRREYDASLGYAPLPETPAMPMGVERRFDEDPCERRAHELADDHPGAFFSRDDPNSASESYHFDEERTTQRGRGGLIAIWAVALGLVALLAIFAGGMLSRERQVASSDRPEQSAGTTASAGAPVAPGQPSESRLDGEQLADSGAAPSVAAEPPIRSDPVATTVTSDESVSRYYEIPPAGNQARPGGEGAVAALGTDEEADAGSGETAAAADVPPPPLPAPRQEEPAPAPVVAQAPAPDRSVQARLLGGGLVNADNVGGRYQGTVGVRIAVGPNGRPSGCQVSRSSGSAALDSATCRLLQQRLQFSPARDRDGNPTSTVVESTHVWGRRPRR